MHIKVKKKYGAEQNGGSGPGANLWSNIQSKLTEVYSISNENQANAFNS